MFRYFIAVCLLTTTLLGCQTHRTSSAKPVYAEWDAFAQKYFDSSFRADPLNATYQGLHTYDDKLPDYSAAAVASRISELKGFRDQLLSIRHDHSLTFDQDIDAEVLLADVNGQIFDFEELQTLKRNPMVYARSVGDGLDILMKRNFASESDRIKSITGRLREVPQFLKTMRANLENPPKEYTDLAIRMMEGAQDFVKGSVQIWAKNAKGIDTTRQADFAKARQEALISLKQTIRWMKTDLLARSKGRFALGADKFARKLYYQDMVSTPLDQLLAIGEAQLAKDRSQFVEVAKKLAPQKSIHHVSDELKLDHPTEKELLNEARKMVGEIKQYILQHNLVPIPAGPDPSIVETPEFNRDGGFASMDAPGPLETKAKEAFYYITPTEKKWTAHHKEEHLRSFNRAALTLTSVHEAYPGHYLQFLYLPQVPSLARKLILSYANVEGWAHYTEQMMLEEGYGNHDLKLQLGQLMEALLRDCRFVVGMKMHLHGMSVEEGVKTFVSQCYLEPANARQETLRGTYDATYLYYTLGKIRIYELREEYRKKKGSSYQIADFHRDFLKQGGIPIPLIRKILIESTR